MATDTMTAPDLDALERLLEQATPGPWVSSAHPACCAVDTATGVQIATLPFEDEEYRVSGNEHADAALIAAAVNALPALLATARRERRMREALEYYANTDGWTYDAVYIDGGFTTTQKRRAIDDDDVDEQGAGRRARAALAEEGQDG